ncbi:AsmA family protein [Psychromonas sp. MME2]|uniref:AsmA family protein n=1 Tax=Psychromonas sp. MME2 TaxID=3231033 RepID=UPI00339BB202
MNLETLFAGDSLPNKKLSSKISSNITYTIPSKKADITDLTLAVDDIQLQGKLSVQTTNTTKVRFDLQGNEWDLTPYLPAKSETADVEGADQNSADPAAEIEPNLAFLNTLDVNGALTIAGIKANEIKIGKIDMKVLVNKGKAEIKPLTALLYDGQLTVNALVDDAKGMNKYNISTTLKDVVIRQLLTDAAKIDFLSGKTAFNFSGSGTGLTSSKIKAGLMGKGDFTLLDGEIYGVNVPQEIRILKAKIKGKELPTEKSIKKTDFASLKGNFTIQKGQVDNQKLLMLSPVMRLDGAGLADILKESLDYKLSITPLSKSDEKTEVYDLNGITIPMLIKGSFSEPKFSLDMDGALNEQLKAKGKELENKAKDKLKEQQDKSSDELKEEGKKIEDKLKGELGKLFG